MNSGLVSIIINNYNYERFLRNAIDSALLQSYSPIEVIVVDDGSTDASREIIASFGDLIIPILKANGGQASAFNAGYGKSAGDIILFLDSDDTLNSNAVEQIVGHFGNTSIAKVHWPLTVINEAGMRMGTIIPHDPLPEGDFKEHALRSGPPFFLNPPTSGNAWSREFIESIMPIPEAEFRIGADTYLFETVAFFGPVKKIDLPLGSYRIHDKNNYFHKPFDAKLKAEINFYESLFTLLERYCQKLGIPANPKIWRSLSWFHQVDESIREIKELIPDHSNIILIDEERWGVGSQLGNIKISPLLEKNGEYDGVPADTNEAIDGIQQLRSKGAEFLVLAWSSFWWLDYLENLAKYLYEHFTLVLKNDHILIFNLNPTV
jgi:glycosyltransferase involved in cell wall biosynthesis